MTPHRVWAGMSTRSAAPAGQQRGFTRSVAASCHDGPVAPVPSLESFYATAYPRVVAMLVLLVGSRHEAEEITQEAFIRLLPRWERVREYEDPEAWVRTAARRLATSRWRRAVVAARALPLLRAASEQGRPRTTDDVDTDLELVGALAQLSYDHREVLVLHHALGLGVDEIARELGVAPGTVKSRLHRAREAARSLATPTDPRGEKR